MAPAKRKKSKQADPQPMLGLGWDEEPDAIADGEPQPLATEQPEVSEEPTDHAPVATEPSPAQAAAAPEEPAPVEEPAMLPEEELSEDDEGVTVVVAETATTPVPAVPATANAVYEDDEEDFSIQTPAPPAPSDGGRPVAPANPAAPALVGDSATASAASRLRNARLAAGLSVARVAEETCLRAQFIEALETGRFGEDMLPLAFCRSYVRRLCGLYCLPEEETVAAFVEEYEAHQEPNRTPRTFHVAAGDDDGGSKVSYVPRETLGESTDGRTSTVGSVLAGLMVLVIVALSITIGTTFVVRYLRANRPPQESQATTATGDESATPAPVPINVRQFILPEELPLDELPIPK